MMHGGNSGTRQVQPVDQPAAPACLAYSILFNMTANQSTFRIAIEANVFHHRETIEKSYAHSTLSDTLPLHRDWPEITTLDLSEIKSHFHRLTSCCAMACDTFDVTLMDLETHNQIFLRTRTPASHSDITEYLCTYTATQKAGGRIFGPQSQYRNAMKTLRLFVTDLIEALLRKGEMRGRMEKNVSFINKQVNEKEDVISKSLRGLVDETSKGGEKFALVMYTNNVRERFRYWQAEEKKLKQCAGECIGLYSDP
ncbi:uncharacterized protein K460DRAFT_358313 [Cucurbitaria berberidis CBS 394.84]|uniref:Uncharacterized protein n=1 Tax=Cucurbitaria berberidis CBS 394.84 TaxID=1168544 RepID=A0A9P4G9N8_9PLEO|nr:uncharacterized protein K460DRAFT_358313 [Cucurbitaria berberidis CBS 394.84]KAF1841575.1 hypothetical protein K460DRAFT_358313 [Cucurbitaria berberidis CBS 394.84]